MLSNICYHPLPKAKLVSSRDDFIVSQCLDKNVLHLGCVGLIDFWNKGTALHLRLSKVAKNIIGVDLNKAAIDYLQQKGIPNLICWDAECIDKLKLSIKIDVIITGELLEHLKNPGLLLQGLRWHMDANTYLIITVPNAFSLRNFLSVLINKKELVRADHHFYFSYMTLRSLLLQYGLTPVKWLTYSNLRYDLKFPRRLVKIFCNQTLFYFSPFTAEGLIVITKKGRL